MSSHGTQRAPPSGARPRPSVQRRLGLGAALLTPGAACLTSPRKGFGSLTTGQPENRQASLIMPEPCDQHESTYALLVRSEEKSRSVFEMVIYPLLILGPLVAIWQFAQQPVNIPATGLKGARCVVSDASAHNNVSRS